MSEGPLIAVVEPEAVDRTIGALKEADQYDPDRRIRQLEDGGIALPITERPAQLEIQDIRQDEAPDYRVRDLEDLLRERGFSPEELADVPRSWAVLGTIVLANFEGCPREEDVGQALLDLHRQADTVLASEGISGAHRVPTVRVVAGLGDTETIHREHGTAYAMDLDQVMFSPGNKAERVRMGEVVAPGEQVFDMFAGIGYFTLPMARAGAEVTATERNPVAFRYLLENAALNEVTAQIDAYRADCRAIRTRADRVVMGYYDATDYLEAGLAALRPHGTLHLHGVAPVDEPYAALEDALETAGPTFRLRDRRIVKTHSPGMAHVVLDAVHQSA